MIPSRRSTYGSQGYSDSTNSGVSVSVVESTGRNAAEGALGANKDKVTFNKISDL